VYFQRPMVEHFTTLFEELLTRVRPAVFDMDDAIFLNLWGLNRLKIRRIISLVRHVVVGNQYLADFVDDPARTTLIPTVVDVSRYRPRTDPDGPFTIGWTGYSSNLKELYPIRHVLGDVLRETSGRLLIIADRCNEPWLQELPVEFVRWSPHVEVRALAEAHVGIMPLADTPYNRGKCGFKLIQYMARGMPTVATPIGANAEIVRDGADGLHAVSPWQWKEALMSLSRDGDIRRRMGQSGRERVERCYSVDAVAPLYLRVLRSVA
jgi:glycosyltransferase involved in cell wall biosynthesis